MVGPIYNAGCNYCNCVLSLWSTPTGELPDPIWAIPDDWEPVWGDQIFTRVHGFVTGAHQSATDNPNVHDHQREANSWTHWVPLYDIITNVTGLETGGVDWDMTIKPLLGFGGVLTYGNPVLGMEFERGYAGRLEGLFDLPQEGDFLVAGGRLIIDCGHNDPYRSEIHPPSVVASVRTDYGFLKGQPATMVTLWANGYYTGEPVDIDVYPPPRPWPGARTTWFKEYDPWNIGVQQTDLTTSHFVRLHLEAPFRAIDVTSGNPFTAGKVKWRDDRELVARYWVYWE
jgi:hypothetical protein